MRYEDDDATTQSAGETLERHKIVPLKRRAPEVDWGKAAVTTTMSAGGLPDQKAPANYNKLNFNHGLANKLQQQLEQLKKV